MKNIEFQTNCLYDNNIEDSSVIIDLTKDCNNNRNIKYKVEKEIDMIDSNPFNKKEKTKNNDNIIVDFYCPPTAQTKKKRTFSLKKIACIFGIAIGITAAIKTATKYHVNNNFNIAVENNKTKKQHKKDDLYIQKLSKTKENNSHHNHLKKIALKDEFELEEVALHYSSEGTNSSVKTRKLHCDNYRIRYIAIVSNDGKEIIEIVRINEKNNEMSIDEFMSYYKVLYGNKIRFQINVDGITDEKVTYKNAGWTSIKNIKRKELQKKHINTKSLTLM